MLEGLCLCIYTIMLHASRFSKYFCLLIAIKCKLPKNMPCCMCQFEDIFSITSTYLGNILTVKVLSICSQNSPQVKNIIISSFKFALADTIFFQKFIVVNKKLWWIWNKLFFKYTSDKTAIRFVEENFR